MLVEDSINAASRQLVRDFQDRGRRAGSGFFETVEGLEALREAAVTPRPTARPTRPPTPGPTGTPSTTPSAAPTRAFSQVARAGVGDELVEGTAQSYGLVFEAATRADAETLLVTGLDIYASVAGEVTYEVRSKEGGWEGFEGDVDAFPVVAAGTAASRGKCEDAADCEGHFIPVTGDFSDLAIKGGGGSRSFYIALTTNELLFSRPLEAGVQVETPGERGRCVRRGRFGEDASPACGRREFHG